MTRPMPGPPECYDIDWHPIWGVVWVDLLDEDDQIVNHSDLDKKRMTDAECSAEYWRAALETTSAALNNCPDCPGCQAIMAEELTWHRFAATPHALEES